MVERLSALLPSHTRRSEESDQFQQFSTPLGLGFVMTVAAQLTPGDLVLEPSAGTGLLAIHAEIAGANLVLNELAETRHALLLELFPTPGRGSTPNRSTIISTPQFQPATVIMNPPFSASPGIDRTMRDATVRHIRSALRRLPEGGRLVVLTAASHDPTHPDIKALYTDLSGRAAFVFTASVDGRIYARHGTTIDTRLTVIDRIPTTDASLVLGRSRDHPRRIACADRVQASTPAGILFLSGPCKNPTLSFRPSRAPKAISFSPSGLFALQRMKRRKSVTNRAKLPLTQSSATGFMSPMSFQTIAIAGAKPHPTKLVQSAAMASVRPPLPSYRPLLPKRLIENGFLSDAQIETIIYAGEAHGEMLAGRYRVDESLDTSLLQRTAIPTRCNSAKAFSWATAPAAAKDARRPASFWTTGFADVARRCGFRNLTSCSLTPKEIGRRLARKSSYRAPIALPPGDADPHRGRHRLHHLRNLAFIRARRQKLAAQANSRLARSGFRRRDPVRRSPCHGERRRREKRPRRQGPSQQGRVGLRLQHALPQARIVYISATGATSVHNLAYAQRLGLWGSSDFPFANRPDFVAAVEAGGIATMEVLARDLKALGLYIARSLSYEGIEVEIVEHELTSEQIRIYDSYAESFQIIHANLEAALKAVNITGESGTLNGQAKAAAKSAFESNKQRFFNHLITAMKTPTLPKSIAADLEAGAAAVVQLVSTGESLDGAPPRGNPVSEWDDLSIDITPREYVLLYLANGFPTQLYERYADDEGNILSRPVTIDGQPVQSREAVEIRDRLIEKLASFPPCKPRSIKSCITSAPSKLPR